MNQALRFVVFLLLAAGSLMAQAPPNTLFYGGDFDPTSPKADAWLNANDFNNPDTFVSAAFVVENLPVAVTGLFVNEIFQDASALYPQAATLTISTGISAGNPGTVIASGNVPVTVTPTGRQGYGDTEYTIQGSFPFPVRLQPGLYWMSVMPQCTANPSCLQGTRGKNVQFFVSNTEGLNAVGPPEPVDLLFITSALEPWFYTPLCDISSPCETPLSVGVIGTQE